MAKTLRYLAVALVLAAAQAGADEKLRWYKGNTHTHTLQSDGDSLPEDVVRWYREHGYHFLVITDHDRITIVESSPNFLVIRGEEVTDRLPGRPLHVNAINLERVVQPRGGGSVVEVLQKNIDAIRAAGGIPAINHPNFGWAFGADELKSLQNVRLLEIASGHPLVNMQGGGGSPSVEEMWDALLASGKRIYGIGVDDSHHFKCPPPAIPALPGKAWVVVRAEALTPQAIVAALERGDFYASTGVEIADVTASPEEITVTIRENKVAKYRTLFIGRGGAVLETSTRNPATYRITGDEGYVRAKVIDSNGNVAWLQPVIVRR